jgi:hypothetical protein
MRNRLIVEVTFDCHRGYVAIHDDLPTITALSLQKLRERIEAHLGIDGAAARLVLDKRARMEHERRRRGGAARVSDYSRGP